LKRAIILTFGALTIVVALDSRLERADTCYEAKQTLEALGLCSDVLEDDSNDPEALWRKARLYCAFGDAKTEKSDRLARYEKAMGYAEKAKDKGSTLAEVWFWYGVSMGKVGQTRGVTSPAYPDDYNSYERPRVKELLAQLEEK
jgi:tetratricopeptide (TPR) repeat protein